MPLKIKPSCVICAWRGDCKKQFSIVNPSQCPDFTLDVTVKDIPGKKGAKVLIEGAPGSGKTTLIERLITKLGRDRKAGGFFTREIREKGERTGFRIITVDKQEGVLAREGIKGSHKVGKYTVNLEDLEKIGVASISRALVDDDIVIVDEIGKMELFSERFRDMVNIALDSDKSFVATVALEGPPFIDEVKGREGVEVLKLTQGNRDGLLEVVLKLLEE